jgi:hypothetical protein
VEWGKKEKKEKKANFFFLLSFFSCSEAVKFLIFFTPFSANQFCPTISYRLSIVSGIPTFLPRAAIFFFAINL